MGTLVSYIKKLIEKIMKLALKKSSVLLVLFTKNNIICTLTTLTGKTLG
jgi:hypothetical protein